MNNASSTMKLPWDFKPRDKLDVVDRASKSFLRVTGVMPPIPSPEAVQSLPEDASLAVGADRSFSIKAIHRAHKRSWSEQITYERKCAYRKWIAIVSENAMAFDVARLQMLSGPMEFARGGLAETIRDALGNKASSTLRARAGPLLRYIKF